MTIGNAGHETPESVRVRKVARVVLRAADVAIAAQLACLLEASAPKPGNISPGRFFADVCYEDFLASAAAIGGSIGGAATRPLGATVRLAVEATARWTSSNTNLGIVLLLAPLSRAALQPSPLDESRLDADRVPRQTASSESCPAALPQSRISTSDFASHLNGPAARA